MTSLKKYNLNGELLGDISCSHQFTDREAHGQMIKDYIVALRANARQWSACTKGRSEVKHTTHKPYAQKGTGRARQGSLVAPQYRGGGRVFGPKPKFDQHIKINRKERRAAIRTLIGEKIVDEQLYILDTTEMKEAKTKHISNFLALMGLERRVLFLGESGVQEITVGDVVHKFNVHTAKHENFVRSTRNMPGVRFQGACSISGYDVLLAQHIVMTEEALREVEEWLCSAEEEEQHEEETATHE